MEIINVEKQTFEELLNRFESFVDKVELLCTKLEKKGNDEWLDSQDVCLILNITLRTLQTYRNLGKIGFSQINYKIYYKVSDINRLLNNSGKKNK